LEILKQGYELNGIAIKLIKKLRVDGVKFIVCSNNFRERIGVLDERFDFLKDFDYIILSYEYGMLKPKLLEKVVEKTKFEPAEIVVIDDGKEIIEEAKRMGFKTILCENPDMIEDYLREVGIFLDREHEMKKKSEK
jgi:HAD superfamily hydrolase (TIGR01509 family)